MNLDNIRYTETFSHNRHFLFSHSFTQEKLVAYLKDHPDILIDVRSFILSNIETIQTIFYYIDSSCLSIGYGNSDNYRFLVKYEEVNFMAGL